MRDHSKMLTIATNPIKRKFPFVKMGFVVASISLIVKLAQGVMTTEASGNENK